jgi:hypothetical protein|tara:strand:- start:137 stop:478 length:342 start_codon:yes stop_codon:yes gene_type:complete
MYISDTNYAEAIDNLEDCMFALASMHQDIISKGYATKEDLAYIEPRFTEALRYIITLNAHPTHASRFAQYIYDQNENGHRIYEALGASHIENSIVSQFGSFLNNFINIEKKGV